MSCATVSRTGLASWFCCGPAFGRCGAAGGGACGNCRSSALHCAWPNASQACQNITRPQDCGITLPRLGCGAAVSIQSRCTGRCTTTTIADCGPDTNRFCGETRSCGGFTGANRIVDLTAAAFAAIDNLDRGIIVVRVDR